MTKQFDVFFRFTVRTAFTSKMRKLSFTM